MIQFGSPIVIFLIVGASFFMFILTVVGVASLYRKLTRRDTSSLDVDEANVSIAVPTAHAIRYMQVESSSSSRPLEEGDDNDDGIHGSSPSSSSSAPQTREESVPLAEAVTCSATDGDPLQMCDPITSATRVAEHVTTVVTLRYDGFYC